LGAAIGLQCWLILTSAVGIWITDTQGLIADAADNDAITLTREALHRHCKLAVGPPGPEGCVIYQLTRRTPKKSK
jgi:hypothetical protein